MENSTVDCFLLTAHSRDNGTRFEITLWGAAKTGDNVRIFTDDFRPLFFCPKTTPENATAAAIERKQLPLRSFENEAVDCLYFNTYTSMQQTARRLKAAGYKVFESDVDPLKRYLMERMVNGSMLVTGTPKRTGNALNFTNPRLRGGTFIPQLIVLAVDIVTDNDEIISAIGCYDGTTTSIFINNNDNRKHEYDSQHARIAKDERQLLASFFAYVKQRDPDIIIGWKVIDTVFRIIQDRCEKNNIAFELGRENGSRVTSSRHGVSRGYTSTKIIMSARIPGRVAMDVPTMLRAYHRSPDEYLPDFGDCPLTNAKTILNIFNSAEILPNAIERSRRSGQMLDGIGGSVASFDHLYLPRLHRAGFVAKDTEDIATPTQTLPGGHVLDPTPGLYENILVFDFKSLYPSIIMTFMIDPLGFKIKDDAKLSNPVGTSFSKNISILPEIIGELMTARATAVTQKNPYLSQAIKILMNSFYGVLGSTGCRFFSEELAYTITLTGQYVLKSSIEQIEKNSGKSVIYGDTDSIFVNLGNGMEDKADEIGAAISKDTGAWLNEHLKKRFGAISKLELKYETHYHRFFIPSIRGGDANQGAKKHYCGAKIDGNGSIKLTFKGMESARSDWTDLAKDFQRELFIKLFSEQPLEDFVTTTAEGLERGDFDAKLIYKKRMRKNIESYAANIPPHVQAAKLLDTPPKLVKYCITKNGPQPIEKLTAPLDYQHYIDSQLRPIANSILWWMKTDFDTITSGQQNLFEGR